MRTILTRTACVGALLLAGLVVGCGSELGPCEQCRKDYEGRQEGCKTYMGTVHEGGHSPYLECLDEVTRFFEYCLDENDCPDQPQTRLEIGDLMVVRSYAFLYPSDGVAELRAQWATGIPSVDDAPDPREYDQWDLLADDYTVDVTGADFPGKIAVFEIKPLDSRASIFSLIALAGWEEVGRTSGGDFSVQWDISDVPGGIYYTRVRFINPPTPPDAPSDSPLRGLFDLAFEGALEALPFELPSNMGLGWVTVFGVPTEM